MVPSRSIYNFFFFHGGPELTFCKKSPPTKMIVFMKESLGACAATKFAQKGGGGGRGPWGHVPPPPTPQPIVLILRYWQWKF